MNAPSRAAILGLSGPALTDGEAALFHDSRPCGAILFGRNVADPGQLRALCESLRAVLPPSAPIMIDQEGGRVARMRPPNWPAHPSAGRIGALPDAVGERAAYLTGALIGLDCRAAGIDVACAPVLDLQYSGQSDVVGDRSYGADPDRVATLGLAMASGLLAAGIIPVAKHAPGHGRATVDSHHALPVVGETDLAADIAPFVRARELPWMMTAHVVYTALDGDGPATQSARVIAEVIRGRIGFRGVLCSDDLAMNALDGPPEARAMRALAAGCDIALYCPGDAAGNAAVLRTVPPLTTEAVARLQAGRDLANRCRLALDRAALLHERDELLI